MGFVESFKEGCDHYDSLLERVLDKNLTNHLKKVSEDMPEDIHFPVQLWGELVYAFLLSYSFKNNASGEDILDLMVSIYDGMIAGYLTDIINLKRNISDIGPELDAESLAAARAKAISEECRNYFLQHKTSFIDKWKQRLDETAPFLTPLDYLEFIPGVPIVLPKRLKGAGNREVLTGDIFKRLQKKYKTAFKNFLLDLGIDSSAPSFEVISRYKTFMRELEKIVDVLCPGNLYTEEGTLNVINNLFEIFPHGKVMAVKWEIVQKLLNEFPPGNLVLRLKFRSLGQLLDNMDARDVLTLAHFTEDKDYFYAIFHWLQDNLRPDSFEEVELKPMVVSRNKFPGLGN